MNNAKIGSYGEYLSAQKSKYYRKAEVWLIRVDEKSNKMLVYVFLFFGLALIIGGVFFYLFGNKRQHYRERPPYL